MIHQILIDTPKGERLATREMYMMMHPSLEMDCELQEGDIVELEEGFFVLNNDLNPMQLATKDQIHRARNSVNTK